MKFKKTLFYSVFMSLVMAFTLGTVVACGDDDPDPTPNPNPNPGSNPGQTENKPTSGVLYSVTGITPSFLQWVDVTKSVTDNQFDKNYQPLNASDCKTYDELSDQFKSAVKSLHDEYPEVSFHIQPIAANSFPIQRYVQFDFAVNKNFTPTDDFNYDYTIVISGFFVDNNGKVYIGSSKKAWHSSLLNGSISETVSKLKKQKTQRFMHAIRFGYVNEQMGYQCSLSI